MSEPVFPAEFEDSCGKLCVVLPQTGFGTPTLLLGVKPRAGIAYTIDNPPPPLIQLYPDQALWLAERLKAWAESVL